MEPAGGGGWGMTSLALIAHIPCQQRWAGDDLPGANGRDGLLPIIVVQLQEDGPTDQLLVQGSDQVSEGFVRKVLPQY